MDFWLRDDVLAALRVDVVDHRGERRRLARAAGADHQDQAASQHDHVFDDLGHAELVELRQLRRDEAQHHCDVAALVEHVDTEAAETGLGQCEVDLEVASKGLELSLVHELERSLPNHLRGKLDLIDGHDLAVDLDHDGGIGGEKKVRRLFVHHQLEERLDVHLGRPAGGKTQKRASFSSSASCKLSDCSADAEPSRLLWSLILRRNSFFESALRIASSYEMTPSS